MPTKIKRPKETTREFELLGQYTNGCEETEWQDLFKFTEEHLDELNEKMQEPCEDASEMLQTLHEGVTVDFEDGVRVFTYLPEWFLDLYESDANKS